MLTSAWVGAGPQKISALRVASALTITTRFLVIALGLDMRESYVIYIVSIILFNSYVICRFLIRSIFFIRHSSEFQKVLLH